MGGSARDLLSNSITENAGSREGGFVWIKVRGKGLKQKMQHKKVKRHVDRRETYVAEKTPWN